MRVTTAIILDTRTARKNGNYTVKLRVTFRRKQKYYPLPVEAMSRDDFAKTQTTRPRGKFKELAVYFNEYENQARQVIQSMTVFSFDKFENIFLNQAYLNNVFSAFNYYIKQLKEEARIGSASIHESAMRSIQKFVGKDFLSFEEVDIPFLKRYEQIKTQEGMSISTVGINLRCVRTIYNLAIEQGLAKRESYPFGRNKYLIPAGRNIKKALTTQEIAKIYHYEPQNEVEAYYRDMWLFSYFGNGLNIKDMARLKFKNMDETKFWFVRAKTGRTKQITKPVIVMLTEPVQKIMTRWSNPKADENYVFPILNGSESPERERVVIQSFTKQLNKYMKIIGKKLEIETTITSYVARHSFATVLKRSGASMEFISESLGHNDLKTTENYLADFEDATKERFAEMLIPEEI